MESILKVVLDQKLFEAIAYDLKNMRTDYYLYVQLVYYTCSFGKPYLTYSVEQIEQLCQDFAEEFPENLTNSIKEHTIGKKKSDYFFSASRNHSQPLSKRTVESAMLKAGRDYGVPFFGSKIITRTALYNKFRQCDYDFAKFMPILRQYHRYYNNVNEFISYCGLTLDEYEDDVVKHASSIPTLIDECDQILNSFKSYRSALEKSNIPVESFSELVDIINKVSVMVATYDQTNRGDNS